MKYKELELYIDGASKGNPGPSGIGAILCRQGEPVKNISVFIGYATNNIAEYTALIYGLKEALNFQAEILKIKSDSQLLCRQLKKIYKVKDAGILNLYNQAVGLMAGFKEVIVTHIPREDNRGADKLANKAVKEMKGG
ncbi:MAG: ribonuclease HI family protein [Candidatus Omnitrophica bacterium]|nr:ribonuclease HI family protein [Candidatus Omnitrophota bacterium]